MRFFLFFLIIIVSYQATMATVDDTLSPHALTRPRYTHPATDLRLHPGKGETVWSQETLKRCSYSLVDGRNFTVEYPEILEITMSRPGYLPEMSYLNWRFEGEEHHKGADFRTNYISASTTEQTNEADAICGATVQNSFLLVIDPTDILKKPPYYRRMLWQLLSHAKQTLSVHQAWTDIQDPFLRHFMDESGFSLHEVFYDSDGILTSRYTLHSSSIPQNQDPIDGLKLEVGDIDDDGPDEPLEQTANFVVRGDSGEILGGCYTVLQHAPGYIFSEIDLLWVDARLRGQGFGARLLELAEGYSREQGARFCELGTVDHQAPWLYRKKGYSVINTIPNLFTLRDGTSSTAYTFRKIL